jgi:protein-tyrosine phosphatase
MTDAGSQQVLSDIHSHLVPGVDDGAGTPEDALEGIGRMVERGVTTIVTTPHLAGSLTRDPVALARRLGEVDEAFMGVSGAVRKHHPNLRFERGHEVLLDLPDPDLSDPRLRLAGTDFVLAEWPRLRIPPETVSALRGIRKQGVTIVIAHPERYVGYDPGSTLIEEWREEGAILQVNYGSLLGRYGDEARTRAFRMLESGWVDCLASDFHGRPGLRLFIEGSRRLFQELGAEETWGRLTHENPDRISRGERPLPVSPVMLERGFLARVRSYLRA